MSSCRLAITSSGRFEILGYDLTCQDAGKHKGQVFVASLTSTVKPIYMEKLFRVKPVKVSKAPDTDAAKKDPPKEAETPKQNAVEKQQVVQPEQQGIQPEEKAPVLPEVGPPPGQVS